jgi:hypothetical protein
MDLDEIISYAIPFKDTDCWKVRQQKEKMREDAKSRLLAWNANEIQKVLNTITQPIPNE